MLNKPPPPNQLSDDHPTLHSPPPPPQKKAEKAISTLPLRKAYVVQFNPCWKFSFLFPVFT